MNISIFVLIFLLFINLYLCHNITQLTSISIQRMAKKHKDTLVMLYLDPKNYTQHFFLEDLSMIMKSYPNYTFGYIDTNKDSQILSFFNLKNTKTIGFIIYNFKKDEFYIEEDIKSKDTIIDILSQIDKNKLNWMTNGIVERIFEALTGKKYGKKAHTYLSFIICILSIVYYTIMNIIRKRKERKEIEDTIKQKARQYNKYI